jgi:methionine synthase I (cobalamin-dependent)
VCGPKIVSRLVTAGADVKVTNGSGMNPLSMALIMHHTDAAEALAGSGAKLTPAQVQRVKATASDARSQAIIQRTAK